MWLHILGVVANIVPISVSILNRLLFNFTSQMILSHLLPSPWIKTLSAKATNYIPKYWERSVKGKSNLNFIRVIKNSSFDQHFVYIYMVQTFLKFICWQFLVPRSERLLGSSATLLWNIPTLSVLVYRDLSKQYPVHGTKNSIFLLSFQTQSS